MLLGEICRSQGRDFKGSDAIGGEEVGDGNWKYMVVSVELVKKFWGWSILKGY